MSSALHSARPLANTVIRRSTEKLYGQQANISRDVRYILALVLHQMSEFNSSPPLAFNAMRRPSTA
jgi:hypothetical protein